MILEELTNAAFSYYSWELTPQSSKPILAACDDCGKIRETSKNQYCALCNSCTQKGNLNRLGAANTEEHNTKISAARKGKYLGEINPNFGNHMTENQKAAQSTRKKGNQYALGRKHTEEEKVLMSKNHPDTTGENNSNYKGGPKVAEMRKTAKRRKLGFISLNPDFEGCQGHHITHNLVINIPEELNQSVRHNIHTGLGMEEINGLALDFLVNGL